MRMGEVNTIAPMASPELSPATSHAVVFSSSPACLSVLRDSRVSRRTQAGTGVGRAASGPCWHLQTHALWAAVFFQAGPAVGLGFPFSGCFILFTDLCIYSKMSIS